MDDILFFYFQEESRQTPESNNGETTNEHQTTEGHRFYYSQNEAQGQEADEGQGQKDSGQGQEPEAVDQEQIVVESGQESKSQDDASSVKSKSGSAGKTQCVQTGHASQKPRSKSAASSASSGKKKYG